MLRIASTAVLLLWSRVADAQLATVGAGALLSQRPAQPVFELHVASPPFYQIRAYTTFSWSDDGATEPTLITAAERSVIRSSVVNVGLGAGILWLYTDRYRAQEILVSSAVIRLPIPRTSVVMIASTPPTEWNDWSLVLKVGVLAWFRR